MARSVNHRGSETLRDWWKQNYVEHTSIHGVPDVVNSSRKSIRVAWVIAILLATIALIAQLTTVTSVYVREEVGTKEKLWIPSNIPPLILCPQFRYIDDPGLSEVLADYLIGYHPMSFYLDQIQAATYVPLPGVTIGSRSHNLRREADAVFAKYGFSFVNLTKHLVTKRYVIPQFGFTVSDITVNQMITGQGLCFITGPNTPYRVTRTSEFAFYVVHADTRQPSKHPSGMSYKMYVGESYDNAAYVGLKDFVKVHHGFDYNVQARVTKRVLYEGRNKDRCRKWTQSDYLHCGATWIDEKYGPVRDCYSGTLPSANFPEIIREKHCNVHDRMDDFGFYAIGFNPEAQMELSEACAQICESTTFEAIAEAIGRSGVNKTDFSRITVALDNPAYSREITEYPIVTLVDYLAAVGGTFGLYCGASILSFVQIFIACVDSATRYRQKASNRKQGAKLTATLPYQNRDRY